MMFYFDFDSVRVRLAVFASVVIHVFAFAWYAYNQDNIIYVSNGVSAVSTPLTISVKRKQVARPVEQVKEKAVKTQEIVVAEPDLIEEPVAVEEEQQYIPVVENAVFEGNRQPPKYPKRAIQMGQEGVVFLQALVDVMGNIKQIDVVQTSGYRLLDKSAINAVWNWKFRPTYEDGTPVLSWIKVPVEFSIR